MLEIAKPLLLRVKPQLIVLLCTHKKILLPTFKILTGIKLFSAVRVARWVMRLPALT